MNSTRHSQSNELTERSNHNVRVYQFQYLVVEKSETDEIFVASILQNSLNDKIVFQKLFADFNSDNSTSTISFSSQQSIFIQSSTFYFVNSFRICQMTNYVKRICRSNTFSVCFLLVFAFSRSFVILSRQFLVSLVHLVYLFLLLSSHCILLSSLDAIFALIDKSL